MCVNIYICTYIQCNSRYIQHTCVYIYTQLHTYNATAATLHTTYMCVYIYIQTNNATYIHIPSRDMRGNRRNNRYASPATLNPKPWTRTPKPQTLSRRNNRYASPATPRATRHSLSTSSRGTLLRIRYECGSCLATFVSCLFVHIYCLLEVTYLY
jgi:hypothetical protein